MRPNRQKLNLLEKMINLSHVNFLYNNLTLISGNFPWVKAPLNFIFFQ